MKEKQLSPELYALGLRNPIRTASLEPTIADAYNPEPLTLKQRIRNMELGYHLTIIGLRLLQAILIGIGITLLAQL